MKISVIVPVYNAAPYLRICLNSILRQTFDNWECICVNDGSTDESRVILEEYAAKDSRIKVINQLNAGVSSARNAGMAIAMGDVLMFLDADDTYDLRALEVVVNVWVETNAEVVRFGCNMVKSHDKDEKFVGMPRYFEIDVNAFAETPMKRCGLGVATALSAKFAKSMCWPKLSHCEDPLFVLRCLRKSVKSVFVEGALMNYLLRPDSASHMVSLGIVTATCQYLVFAYDECAAMPGFANFRFDTCSFICGFLNEPLARCGDDVALKDREAAKAAVYEAWEQLSKRDEIFRLRAIRGRYDFVFSLGAACSGTEILRDAKLQYASFPFDWLLGPGLLERVKLVTEEFSGWMNDAGDFAEIPNPDAFKHASYYNRRTGYSYLHDFKQDTPFAAQFTDVCKKYQRRCERLLDLMRGAKRVLVVWTSDPRDKARIAEEDLFTCLAKLRTKFPGVAFKLLAFECVSGISAMNPEVSVREDVARIAFDYRVPNAGNDWAIHRELLLPYLEGISVADYRTPEIHRTHARAVRARDRERFPAKTYFGYLLMKLEFKIYKHIKKALTQRGVCME